MGASQAYNWGMARRNPTVETNLSKNQDADPATLPETSDAALAALLERVKITADPGEIQRLTDQIEQIIFHKQFTNA